MINTTINNNNNNKHHPTETSIMASPPPKFDYTSYFTHGTLDLSTLRDYYRNIFRSLTLIESQPTTPKALILDPDLQASLSFLFDRNFYKEENVESMQMISEIELMVQTTHIIYIVKPTIYNARCIVNHIHSFEKDGDIHLYTILCCPQKTFLFEMMLEEINEQLLNHSKSNDDDAHEGDINKYYQVNTPSTKKIHDSIRQISHFPIDFFPIDNDLFSMQQLTSTYSFYLMNDPTDILPFARGLAQFQCLFQYFPYIKCKGSNAHQCHSVLQSIINALPNAPNYITSSTASAATPNSSALSSSSSTNNNVPPFHTLFIFDRSVDFLTPLLIPTVYEGLLDEFYGGIQNNTLEVEASVVADKTSDVKPAKSSEKTKKIFLNSSDPIYRETRGMSFRVVGSYLHRRAAEIQSTYDERHAAAQSTQSMKQVKTFFNKFLNANTEHYFLTLHVNIAEKIAEQTKSKIFDIRCDMERNCLENSDLDNVEEYIDLCMAKGENMYSILRLLGIFSLTNGIRQRKLDSFKRDFLQTFGHEHVLTLTNLEKIGLLSSSKRNFNVLKRTFRLLSEFGEHAHPTNQSYVYNGYSSLLSCMVETALEKSGRRTEELWKDVPGSYVESHLETVNESPVIVPVAKPPSSPKQHDESRDSISGDLSDNSTPIKKSIVGIAVIGGMTYAEINTFRYLSERPDHPYEYILFSTAVCGGNQWMQSFSEDTRSSKWKYAFERGKHSRAEAAANRAH